MLWKSKEEGGQLSDREKGDFDSYTYMCPSLMSLATPFRELAVEISAASWGSSQTREQEANERHAPSIQDRGRERTLPLTDTGHGGGKSLLDTKIGELGHLEREKNGESVRPTILTRSDRQCFPASGTPQPPQKRAPSPGCMRPAQPFQRNSQPNPHHTPPMVQFVCRGEPIRGRVQIFAM